MKGLSSRNFGNFAFFIVNPRKNVETGKTDGEKGTEPAGLRFPSLFFSFGERKHTGNIKSYRKQLQKH